jgi:hypothetical protein
VEALRSPEAARERAGAGRRWVLERHSLDRLLGDVDALYKELLSARMAAA